MTKIDELNDRLARLQSPVLADEIKRLREINADLLDALDRMMEYAHIGASACDIDRNEQPQFVKARAAIARARGKL